MPPSLGGISHFPVQMTPSAEKGLPSKGDGGRSLPFSLTLLAKSANGWPQLQPAWAGPVTDTPRHLLGRMSLEPEDRQESWRQRERRGGRREHGHSREELVRQQIRFPLVLYTSAVAGKISFSFQKRRNFPVANRFCKITPVRRSKGGIKVVDPPRLVSEAAPLRSNL